MVLDKKFYLLVAEEIEKLNSPLDDQDKKFIAFMIGKYAADAVQAGQEINVSEVSEYFVKSMEFEKFKQRKLKGSFEL